MLGILGALAFGAVVTGAWINADQTEQQGRQSSKEHGHEFYFDKNGRMRHVGSGRKYTPEEIHQFMNPTSVQEGIMEYEKKCTVLHEKLFYKVWIDSTQHYFLTEEDALDFYNDFIEKHPRGWYVKLCKEKCDKLELETTKGIGGVFHFDYDKYVGILDKPWERM